MDYFLVSSPTSILTSALPTGRLDFCLGAFGFLAGFSASATTASFFRLLWR